MPVGICAAAIAISRGLRVCRLSVGVALQWVSVVAGAVARDMGLVCVIVVVCVAVFVQVGMQRVLLLHSRVAK